MQNNTRFLLICTLLLLNSNWLSAQVEVSHKDDWFLVEPGTNVHIEGNLHSLENNSFELSNLGGMYISDSVKSNGPNRIFGLTPDTVTANVYLNGDKKQWLVGKELVRFGNLHLRNAYDSLEALQGVEVYNLIKVDSGNLKLTSVTLDLLFTGRMSGESNEKRIYTDQYGKIRFNRFLQSGVSYDNMFGSGVGMTINGNLGTSVEILRTNHQQPNVSNGSIDRYYSFNPQRNGFVSEPKIYYLDSNELNGNDDELMALYISQSAAATWLYESSSVDTTADIVSADSTSSFVLNNQSMFTLAEKDCDSVPFLQFTLDTIPLCNGASAYLKPLGIEGLQKLWSTGTKGADSIQVTQSGTYYVTVTNLAGCTNVDSIVVISAPDPVVDYALSPVCLGDTTFFTNNSTISSGSMTFAWELGDPFTPTPDTSSAVNPNIVYANQGIFTTTLTATSNYGCIASLSKNSIAKPYPLIDITIADNCEDSTLSIVNNTTVTPTAGITYSWDFNQEDTLIGANPSYQFVNEGVKLIDIEATSNGCTTMETKVVKATSNPVANFTTTSTCLGAPTAFANTSSIVNDSIGSYRWTFEAGATAILPNPTYTYASAGTYPVRLKVTSKNGCVHDTLINVSVDSLPTPTFTTMATCMGDSTAFINSSSANSIYSWDFNGEGSSNAINPKFLFNTAGNKIIRMTETNVNGCSNTSSTTIVSQPRPTANFAFQSAACETDVINFTNTSSTPSGNIAYTWNYGSGNASTQVNPRQQFNTAGNYSILLVAEVNGCIDSTEKQLTVDPKPVVNLGGSITTCGNSYNFDAGNAGSSFLWSNNSTNQTLPVNFSGTYWVQVTNASGCKTSDTVQIALNTAVTPNLGADATFCDGTTLDAGFPGASYAWSNAATSKTINVTTSGQYSVTVTDQNGCLGSDTINISVVNSVLPNLGPDIAECDGIVTALDPVNIGVSYLWNTQQTSSTINVSSSGEYWVQLTDVNGCVSRDTIDVTYNPNPILDLGSDGTYCDSTSFDITQPNVSYLWNDNATSPLKTIANSGVYSVTVTDNTTNCFSTDTIDITLAPKPIVELGEDTTLCGGATVVLDAKNQLIGADYLWNIGDTSKTITAAASGSYVAFVTSPAGCVGTDTINVTISSPLNTDLGPDFVLCAGTSAQLTSPINGASYQWLFNGVIQAPSNQIFTATQNGTYVVNVTDSGGCVATDTIKLIDAGSTIIADFIANTNDVKVGDTLKFVNLSFPSGYTSSWDFGDGSFSIAEDPSHLFLTEGPKDVKLKVSNGTCFGDTTKTIIIRPLRKSSSITILDTIVNSFDEVNLFPNPNNGNYNLTIELLEEGNLFIELYNINGQRLLNEALYGKDFNLYYNNEHLSRGIYLIRMRVNEEYKTLRFIKK